ncbi:hypothetical protein C7212DRAFT_361424 [Tuber magnatum]|uniref:Uncharacterized protein n=1 Tax=Tuber magnatum TaxID=42249 RepID=A0A317SZS8_9PEZI|nr:hypothetical protein C7212DRAFT_361424 [Tuber magnatum]
MSSITQAEIAQELIDVVDAVPDVGEAGPSHEKEKKAPKHDGRDSSVSGGGVGEPPPGEAKKESSRSQGKESANASNGSEETRSRKKSSSKQKACVECSRPGRADIVAKCPWTEYEMSINELDYHFDKLRTLPLLFDKLKELSEENEKLRALQDDMLSGIDRFHPTPDSAIVEKVVGLRGQIRIFTKTFSRQLKSIKEEPSVRDRLKGRTLTALIDGPLWEDSRNVVLLAESVIWKKIVNNIFWSPFQVFGERLEDTWKGIFDEDGKESADAYPVASEQSEKWRNATVLHLTSKAHKNPEKASVVAATILEQLEDGLTSILGIDSLKAPDQESLRKIVIDSCEFAALLGQQRCRLRFYTPEAGIHFDTSDNKQKLEATGSEEIQFGKVAFVSAPGLRKWGNGYGQNLEELDVIVGARVKVVELS